MRKVIKDRGDYETALTTLEQLVDLDPDLGTPEAEDLELLALLVEDFESKMFKKRKPEPLEAIKFRMDQQNLTQRDLIPYIGSRSKVSEVLNGKRPLTLAMIRALHVNLGIPADALLAEGRLSDLEVADIVWARFPLREMIERGWITDVIDDVRGQCEDVLRRYFERLGSMNQLAAHYRRADHVRSARKIDRYALTAWTTRVVLLALDDPPKNKYVSGTVDLDFMQKIARLSTFEQGPLLAREYLAKNGVSLVVEPHLPKTLLDGAAIMASKDHPVIALTIRHDRLDNFWFCLMHELAHISLHLSKNSETFYDDLDVDSQDDALEMQADELAGEALIPSQEWQNSPASQLRSPNAAQSLARQLSISPAIVAGRMRYEFKAYRLLNQLVGHRQVRVHFSEIKWSK